MNNVVRMAILGVVVIGAGAAMVARGRPEPSAPAPRTIVLAELFTSEGCSSCPPADALLRRLVADQPIEGVEIVALGSHVDYWDRLGWRDPFSSPVFSERQERYSAHVFRLSSVYTPQVVVDGSFESVGSDEAAVRRNILAAARTPRAIVQVAADAVTRATVQIEVSVDVPEQVKRTGPADVLVAVTEDGLASHVQRGENGGRTLLHSAVVHQLKMTALLGAADRHASSTVVIPVDQSWTPAHLRFVAFVQEQASRRIMGAAATTLASRAPAY